MKKSIIPLQYFFYAFGIAVFVALALNASSKWVTAFWGGLAGGLFCVTLFSLIGECVFSIHDCLVELRDLDHQPKRMW